MDIKDFEKAEPIFSKIEDISSLLENYSLGRVSNSEEFEKNNNDFYTANFIKVFETKGFHSTGEGHTSPSRITIAKYSDMSGPNYVLSKQETIKLQVFLKTMLDKRLNSLKIELENI